MDPAGPEHPRPGPGLLLALVNPPLVAAAAVEVLAGTLLAGVPLRSPIPFALAAASGLIFAAGATFGHLFDREADARTHPERPLPSGAVRTATAWRMGWAFLAAGAVLCAAGGLETAALGTVLALAVTVHAALGKQILPLGFLTIGAARGLNLLLGFSAGEAGLRAFPLEPLAVTAFAVGWALLRAIRQPGAAPSTPFVALVHLAGGLAVLLFVAQRPFFLVVDSLPFLAAALAVVLPRVVDAIADPRRGPTLVAVQWCFLGLTLLEAAMVGGERSMLHGGLVAMGAVPVYLALRRWPLTLKDQPR